VPLTSLHQLLFAAVGFGLCLPSAAHSADTPETRPGRSLTEFDGNDGMNWKVVDDGVMGGLSEGRIAATEAGTMKFSGLLSLENNGGFSSFRSDDVNLDLSNELGLVLRVLGDGRTYQARLATDARYRGMEVSFAAEFATTKGEWTEVKVPFTAFTASFRGTALPDEKLDAAKIRRLSILLGDKKQAPFAIELDFIRTYRATAAAE
jgi:NADH dehydrogenase [ubiquinone] 1 alpha subcomplex assembly factor 1